MDIDVVLVSGNAQLAGARQVITASSAKALVAAVRARLGTDGRIDRLRILDSWGGPGTLHPLKSASDLAELHGLFSPEGRVELFAGPAPAPSAGTGIGPVSNFSGGGGFSGGLGGGGSLRLRLIESGINLSQLSSALGVPVTSG